MSYFSSVLYRLRRHRKKWAFSGVRHPALDSAADYTRRNIDRCKKELAGIAEIAAVDREGEFTSTYSSLLRPLCHLVFSNKRQDVRSILEIGAFEGRSAMFFATYFPEAQIDSVDRFDGGSDFRREIDWAALEARFDRNVARFQGRVTKHKGLSRAVLSDLEAARRSYDLAFVDANHFHDDAYIDTVFAWAMLREGGVLIWDDYTWFSYQRPLCNPRAAIDRFMDVHAGEYQALAAAQLVFIRKMNDTASRIIG